MFGALFNLRFLSSSSFPLFIHPPTALTETLRFILKREEAVSFVVFGRIHSQMASRAAPYLRIQVTHRGFASVVKDLIYANSHEWVKVDRKSATIGITDHAQDHLGDVYVELPEVGVAVKQGGGFGAVEGMKATSDVYTSVSGKVVEVNEELTSSPGLVREEAQ